MRELKVEYVDIDSIKPYKNNAKQHPKEQIEQIKQSIEMFGMDDPIGIWNDEIVEGHGRLIACKELGYKEVPIIRLDHLTDEQRKAYGLIHNKLTMNSDFDIDALNQELEGILDIDMEDFGFDLIEKEEDEANIVEDEPPEPPEEPKAKLGDIYQLGQHRLMCGDSTKAEDVEKLMGGEKAELLFTDPPYNVDYGNIQKSKVEFAPDKFKGANTRQIANDHMEAEAFINFLTKAFANANEVLTEGRSYYIWHGSTESYSFLTAMKNVDWELKQQLIWNKSSLCLSMSDYQWKHEPCFYGWKKGSAHYFTDDRKQSTVIEDDLDFDKMKKEDMKKLLEEIFSEKVPMTVINEKKPLKSDLHPTMKPIRLCARLINNSTRKHEKVLDLFGGSGSTLIACEQLERKCYMMEYDPKYVDTIIERWENFTGEKATKIN